MESRQDTYFSVDSRLLFQLGEKLLTDRAVALAELVKNSYDADATIVTIRMRNIRTDGGTIVVEDNGTGMTLPTFKKTWMRIATIDKEENPISAKCGRKKAGEKGIGRFACRRLSRRLELKSVAQVDDRNKEELTASFTWSDFVPGSELESTPVACSTVPVGSERPTGTVLTLDAITEPWHGPDIRRLRCELMDLISPLTFESELEIAPKTHDPGFHVKFDCPEFPAQVEPLDSSFFKNAWARLSGSVDDEGLAYYGLQTTTDIEHQAARTFRRGQPFNYLRRTQMEVYLFSYRADFFGNSEWKMGQTRRIGDERGGIKVYADNFRVFGYGGKGDDWLGTDYDRARSSPTVNKEVASYIVEGERPGLNLFRNNNLFGHVVFSRDANKTLEITVNRERIVSSEAFEELRRFARLGIDFATVLYSNQVAREIKEKEEEGRAYEEALARANEESWRRAEEARQKAEEEADRAEEEKRRAEEEARRAQFEAAAASDKRRVIEEQRRQAEEARRQAEAEASKTADPQLQQSIAIALSRERQLWEAELGAVENERTAMQRAQEARTRAEGERAHADEEVRRAEEERRKAEEQQRRADEEELRRRQDKYEREFLLLRVLASTGTLILIFEHELQALIEDMEEMVGNSSAVLAKMPDTEKSSFNEVLESFANRTEMIKELGEFLGLTMGAESRLEKKEWVLYPIVESVFRPFRWYLKESGIDYKNSVPDTLRTPRMYRSELVSVLHNLMSNAFKAVRGEHRRQIEVTGSIEDAIVHIWFLDSGKGLPKTRWEEVFEPFETDSEPDIKFGVGTGLGLKIVRDIVRSYDGEVGFCEPPDGWTTCVEITLPGEE